MSDQSNSAPAEAAQPEITAAQAAQHVNRQVPVIKDGQPTGKTRAVAVKTDEVLAHSLRDGLVTVVTIDGQKFTAPVNPKIFKGAA